MSVPPPRVTRTDALFPYPTRFRAALVQADAGFVQHIEHARQAGTDLRGKADALALPAGQGAAGAIKVQIFKADIVEETHPLDDFLQYPLSDLALLVGQLVGQRERPLIRLIHRAADGVGDSFPERKSTRLHSSH